MATANYYQRQLVDRKIYLGVWSKDCLFLLIEKAVAMVCFLSPQSTHKDSILHYKTVMIKINAFNIAKVILDVVKRYRNFSDLVATNRGSLLLV